MHDYFNVYVIFNIRRFKIFLFPVADEVDNNNDQFVDMDEPYNDEEVEKNLDTGKPLFLS